MKLSDTAKAVYNHAKARMENGEVPTMLGLQGMLALMWDRIRRFNKEGDCDEILGLAGDALFAAKAAMEALGADHYEETEYVPEPSGKRGNGPQGVVQGPKEIPAEFADADSNPESAAGLLDWLMAQGFYDAVDPDFIEELNEVAYGTKKEGKDS